MTSTDDQRWQAAWIERIRGGEDAAWRQLVQQFEGRLLAFARARLGDREAAEDIVQETLIGFYRSLPHFDAARPIESYLFQICAFKVTDHLRRSGRSVAETIRAGSNDSSSPAMDVAASGPAASSIARSAERRGQEETAVAAAIRSQIDKWQAAGDYTKLGCIELLFVSRMANKEVAERLGLTEQQVANYKSDFLARTRQLLSRG